MFEEAVAVSPWYMHRHSYRESTSTYTGAAAGRLLLLSVSLFADLRLRLDCAVEAEDAVSEKFVVVVLRLWLPLMITDGFAATAAIASVFPVRITSRKALAAP